MKEGEGTSSPLSIRRRPADWAPYGHVIVIVRLVTSFSIHSIQLCWRSALCRWWPSSPSISYIRSRSTVTTGISDICFLLSYLLSSCQHQRSNSGRQDIIEAHAFLSAILPLQQFLNWLPCQLVTAARTFKGGSVGTTWMKPWITQPWKWWTRATSLKVIRIIWQGSIASNLPNIIYILGPSRKRKRKYIVAPGSPNHSERLPHSYIEPFSLVPIPCIHHTQDWALIPSLRMKSSPSPEHVNMRSYPPEIL